MPLKRHRNPESSGRDARATKSRKNKTIVSFFFSRCLPEVGRLREDIYLFENSFDLNFISCHQPPSPALRRGEVLHRGVRRWSERKTVGTLRIRLFGRVFSAFSPVANTRFYFLVKGERKISPLNKKDFFYMVVSLEICRTIYLLTDFDEEILWKTALNY